MDLTTILILGGVALVAVVAALWMLRRAWGDFPNRVGMLPPAGISRQPSIPTYDPVDGSFTSAALSALEVQSEPPRSLEATFVPPGLVPIENPMVLRAAEAAVKKGDQRAARYIVRDGGKLYFSFDQIADPTERQVAYDMMRRLNAGEDVDIRAVLKLVQQMFM
jgi:hypothetical protein